MGFYPVTHSPVTRCPGQGRGPPPAGPALRARRPRHAPNSIGGPRGEPLPRIPAACAGASPVGASPVAFPPSRSPPPWTSRSQARLPASRARPSARWSGPQRQQPQRPFQGLTDWKPARFFREGRCSAHIGASVRTCRGEGLKRAPAAAALTKRGGRRRDPRAGPRGGTPRRDLPSGPPVGTSRRDPTPAAPKNEPQKQLVVQEIFPCA